MALVTLLSLAGAGAWAVPAQAETDEGLRVVGELPALSECNRGGAKRGVVLEMGPCPLIVDSRRNIGWSVGTKEAYKGEEENVAPGDDVPGRAQKVYRFYDLERLTVIADVPCSLACSVGTGATGTGIGRFAAAAADPVRPRLYFPLPAPSVSSPNGLGQPSDPTFYCGLQYLDYGDLANLPIPQDSYPSFPKESYDCGNMGNTVARDLVTMAVAIPAPDRFYLSGYYKTDYITRTPTAAVFTLFGPLETPLPGIRFLEENLAAPLIIRQLRRESGQSPEELVAEWDLDLRYAACGRRPQRTRFDPPSAPYVTRLGSDLLAYCWDPKATWTNGGALGEQGYLVRIPLDAEGRPLSTDGGPLQRDANGAFLNYRFVRSPTFLGAPALFADQESGLLLMVTDGGANGSAVWLFDPKTDRFVGVATGGFAEQPPNNISVGLDASRGRVYILTQDGVLMVPTRQRPLSGGLLFPVAENEQRVKDWANSPSIPVAPRLQRLFIPLNFRDQCTPAAAGNPYDTTCGRASGLGGKATPVGARYLVVEDRYADPPETPPSDPDDNTTQIAEVEGSTEVAGRGQGSASGAHVILVGGAPRVVDQVDPACRAYLPLVTDPTDAGGNSRPMVLTLELYRGKFVVEGDFAGRSQDQEHAFPSAFANGSCAADQALSPGKREVFLAATKAEVGTGSGAVGRGAALAFGTPDATDDDTRNLGQCGAGTFANLAQGNDPGEDFAAGCNGLHDGLTGRSTDESGVRHEPAPDDPRAGVPDLRDGTQGRDGTGFPLPAAVCGDYGSGRDVDSEGGVSAEGVPVEATVLASSSTVCDAARTAVTTAAEAAGFSLAEAAEPVFSVARTASSVVSRRDPAQGQLTVAYASAEGVRLGPIVVREVRSFAITRAKGRTGTAETTLVRQWCGIGSADAEKLEHQTVLPIPTQECIDPASEANESFLSTVNAGLTKMRLSVPPANGPEPRAGDRRGEATDGGYQAVVVKDPDVRAGDEGVNDDTTYTVSALEAVVYNDGWQGRSRVVVQLAGVHAESRYGIAKVPDFGGFGPPTTSTVDDAPPTTGESGGESGDGSSDVSGGSLPVPEEYFEEFGSDETVRTVASRPFRGSSNPVLRLLQAPAEILKRAIELLVNHPREFALLFVMWSVLAAPGYLFLRRRAFARTLVG